MEVWFINIIFIIIVITIIITKIFDFQHIFPWIHFQVRCSWHTLKQIKTNQKLTQCIAYMSTASGKETMATSMDFKNFSTSASLDDFGTNASPGVLSYNMEIKTNLRTELSFIFLKWNVFNILIKQRSYKIMSTLLFRKIIKYLQLLICDSWVTRQVKHIRSRTFEGGEKMNWMEKLNAKRKHRGTFS